MRARFIILLLLICAASGCAKTEAWTTVSADKLSGPLISSRTTMVTAWDYPRNPLTDTRLGDTPLDDDIRWGFKLFVNTSGEAPHLSPGRMSCNNCHLNGGQRERSLPLVGIAGMFPEYNRRSGRLYGLADRIVDCFMRSQNATGVTAGTPPTASSPEVLALQAYLTWLARDFPVGQNPEWRGRNTIAVANRLPMDRLDPKRGEALFMENCTNCHGEDGQGVQIGDKRAGPLWGPDSWNDGAGAARIYTLAGIIRYAMPYLEPGKLSDEEAQHVASFINSKPRPSYPYKDRDYLTDKVPVDSVYYTKE